MVRLRLPDELVPFVDENANREYLSSGTYSVPPMDQSRYLDAGWVDADSDDDGMSETHWATLVKEIEAGEHDTRLEQLVDRERRHDPSPRSSVIEAIRARKSVVGTAQTN